MILLSFFGWATLFCLLIWQLLLKFRKSWVFRSGEQLYFLMPEKASFSKAMTNLVSLGFLILSVAIWLNGISLLHHVVIAAASWLLIACYLLATSSRLISVSPDRVKAPFRLNARFDRIEAIKLFQDAISFRLSNKTVQFEFPATVNTQQKRTILMLMETLKSTANLQGTTISNT